MKTITHPELAGVTLLTLSFEEGGLLWADATSTEKSFTLNEIRNALQRVSDSLESLIPQDLAIDRPLEISLKLELFESGTYSRIEAADHLKKLLQDMEDGSESE